MYHLNTADYLFLKFRSTLIKLDDVCKEFYPHLCKEKVLEKARQQKFPFACFRIDESQKGAFFVEIHELAQVLDDIYKNSYQSFLSATQKAINSKI
ncbi:pyocin activator PrtN family protein [Acinetobacter sp. ANC 3781]